MIRSPAPPSIPARLRAASRCFRNSSVPHEFRLTFAPQLSAEDAAEAALLVKGCERFYLQQYRPRDDGDPKAHPPEYVQEAAEKIRRAIGVCTVRGLGPAVSSQTTETS
jgi:hypothetical protein